MTDYTVPRDSRRVPLATRVQLKFEWFSGFISEYSSNISPGGMFIRTQTPEPPGRVLGFEFRLGDGFELIQGTGEVMWVRPLDESPEKPAGMGIRFIELSPQGGELIERMVENYIREGGTPFDVAKAPAPAPVAAAPAPVPAPPDSIPAPRPAASPAPVPPRVAATAAPPAPIAAAPAPRPAPPPAAPPVPAPPAPQASAPAMAAPPPAPRPAAAPGPPPAPEPRTPAPGPSPAPAAPEPSVRGAAQPSSWTSILAGATAPAASPAAPIPAIPEPEPDRGGGEETSGRPVHASRIVLWTLLAAFLGVAGWVALKQDLLLGWMSRRGTAPSVAHVAAHHAVRHRGQAVPAAAPADGATPGGPSGQPPPSASARLPEAPPPASSQPAPPPPTAASAPPAPAPAVAVSAAERAATGMAASADTTAPLTEIEKITWQEGPDGTEIVLWGNGAFRRQDFAHYRVEGDPPRVLIKLRGIRHPFAEGRLLVGTRQVRQVRTGYHDEGGGSELHVVLDLAGFGVEVTGMREDAATLHIFLKGS